MGACLCKRLYASGERVTGVFHKNKDNLVEGPEYYPIEELEGLEGDYTHVFIISAYVPEKGDYSIEERLQKVNVELVSDILKKFTQAKVIHCSTVSVYGVSPDAITESSSIAPINPYGQSKSDAEDLVALHPNHAIVRFSSIYGPHMRTHTFLPQIIIRALEKGRIVVFGDGSRSQNYIAVEEAVDYLIKAANSEQNGVYLAVGQNSYANKDVAGMIADLIPNVTIAFEGSDPSPSFFYNNAWTRSVLGIDEVYSFQEELKKVIGWLEKK